MRLPGYLATFIVLTCSVVACDLLLSSRSVSSADVDSIIVIEEGKVVPLPDGESALRFVGKLEESRCPRGVECVHAGEARIKLKLISGTRDSTEFIMMIPGFVDSGTRDGHKSQKVGDYQFTLVELNPYPDARRPGSGGRSAAKIRLVQVRGS